MKGDKFGLVEIMITTVIVAIIAAMIVPTILNWGKDTRMIQPPLIINDKTAADFTGVVVVVDHSDRNFIRAEQEAVEVRLDQAQIVGQKYVICFTPTNKFKVGDMVSVRIFYYKPDDMTGPIKGWIAIKR